MSRSGTPIASTIPWAPHALASFPGHTPAGNLALAPTRLVCVENTHNAAGGAVLPLSSLAALHGACRDAGIPVHMDGARLFNAAAFLDMPVAEICRHVESVWFALCKGLGGPVGAILAGDAAFMQRARRAVKMLGGGMRQAGLIAAPALVALEAPWPGLRRDHALARKLADGLAAIDPSLVDAADVQTNIVNCFVDRFVDRFGGDATAIVGALRERGVLANGKRNRIHFVTHAQVDEAAVEAAVAAVAEVIGGGRRDPTRRRGPMTERRADAAEVVR